MSDRANGAKLRARAAQVVDDVIARGHSLDRALAEHEKRIPVRDHALLRNLSYGTLRYHWHLQAWLDGLLSRPLKQRDSCINQLLTVGLYQLSDTRIPDHAVVSETVEAARLLRRPKLAGLVNAILRRFIRERATELEQLDETAQYDHPRWLIDMLRVDWPDQWQAILAANNARAPMWLRCNPAHGTPADYLARLEEAEIAAELFDGLPQAVRLVEPQAVQQLPGFVDGHVSVQDGAAQLAAPWLLSELRGRVLDACAAPGGKSGHLLEIGGDAIEVVSLDSDARRLESVEENLARLALRAKVVCGDAAKPPGWWDGDAFDAILIDAPCSASGVIRRHPDIKHLRRPDDVLALAATQAAILEALWPTLKPGGRLLYVTCSVLRAENDSVISDFLDSHADAQPANVLQNNNIRDLMQDTVRGQQILPGTAGMDGFYFACMNKDA